MLKNKFPIYVPSYGRYDEKLSLTANALLVLNADFTLIVESEQYDAYVKRFGKDKVIAIPKKYHDEYENCDDLGQAKSQGPGPARNFAWDDSKAKGYKWHWVMDDNIDGFYIYNNNRQILAGDMTPFVSMEAFCLQYDNLAMAGPNYFMFVARKKKYPPFILNTRIYSCNLIRNDLPYRWRGRYNEDTDLTLRMLKDGWCTIQFNMFLQQKIATQHVKGGNKERFYDIEGTYPKTEMLKRLHPAHVRLVYKFRRWHHSIDYAPFKGNKLVKIANLDWKPPKLIVKEINHHII